MVVLPRLPNSRCRCHWYLFQKMMNQCFNKKVSKGISCFINNDESVFQQKDCKRNQLFSSKKKPVFQQKGCKRNQLFSYKKKPVFQQKRLQKESVVFIEKKPVFQQKRLVPGCSVDDVDGVLKRRFQIVCQVIHMRGAVPVISEMPNVTDIIEKSQSNIDKNPSD